MVERVYGAEGELDVALGIDVVGGAEGDFGEILDVAVFVDDDDALGEHGLAHGPDAGHDLAGVAGVGLADTDDHEVVEDSLGGEIDVDDLRHGELHEGKEDALDGLAHPGVFHGGLADDGCGVDGVFAVGDAGEMEDGVVVLHGVEAGVIAEGALGAEFAEVDEAFEDVLGVGGDFKVDRLGLDEFEGFLAEEAGDEVLLDLGGGGDDGGEGGSGVGADGYGDFQAVALDAGEGLGGDGAGVDGLGGSSGGEGHEVYGGGGVWGGGAEEFAHVFGGDLLALPVHSGGLAVVDLHAVHADVALAGFGVAGDDAWEGDEAAAVLGPGLQDGELVEVDVLAFVDDLLAGGVFAGDDFGEEAADFGEFGEEFELVEHGDGGDGVEEDADAIGDGVKALYIQGELHAGLGAELVHEDAGAGVAGDVLEEEGGASGFGCSLAEFGGSIGDLRHLQVRGDGLLDALDFVGAIERFNPFAQVRIGQGLLLIPI